MVSDVEVEEGGDEWRFIVLWNIMKKGKKGRKQGKEEWGRLGYWNDHDNAPHLGLSRLRFLKMCSGCKSALV